MTHTVRHEHQRRTGRHPSRRRTRCPSPLAPCVRNFGERRLPWFRFHLRQMAHPNDRLRSASRVLTTGRSSRLPLGSTRLAQSSWRTTPVAPTKVRASDSSSASCKSAEGVPIEVVLAMRLESPAICQSGGSDFDVGL